MNAGEALAVKTDELTRTFGNFRAVSELLNPNQSGTMFRHINPAKDFLLYLGVNFDCGLSLILAVSLNGKNSSFIFRVGT